MSSPATAADAAAMIIRDMCLRSGDSFLDMLVVDHDSKFTSEVFRAFVKGWGSCLIVGSAYHKNTNAKVERANGIISDTLRAYANGRKDDWDSHLPLAVFAINNAASTLGGDLTPFFVDRGAHPRLPLSPPREDRTADESPAHYAQRMRAIEETAGAGGAEAGLAGSRGVADPRPRDPRPRAKSSDPRPATPSDPARLGHFSNARSGPDISQDRDSKIFI